jgi:pyruvate dehydrogenase E1 component
MGEAGEGRNPTHQQKKLNEAQMRQFRDRFEIPVPTRTSARSRSTGRRRTAPRAQYLRERRQTLGGFLPERRTQVHVVPTPERDHFQEFFTAVDRDVSTTMVFVQILRALLKHPELGKKIVPIVPDEARTFGMESLFRSYGIYASQGQLYEPVDVKMLLSYHEAQDGRSSRRGSPRRARWRRSSPPARATRRTACTRFPFFIFYSMFGFQRVGDLIWAFGDQRGRGFLMGATAGRTTLNGEGCSTRTATRTSWRARCPTAWPTTPPSTTSWRPSSATAAAHVRETKEPIFYYITLYNENYPQLAMPEGVEEGILKGLYLLRAADGAERRTARAAPRLGLAAARGAARQEILATSSASPPTCGAPPRTSAALRGAGVRRWNLLHPGETPKVPYVRRCWAGRGAGSRRHRPYMRLVPDQIARWVPQGLTR